MRKAGSLKVRPPPTAKRTREPRRQVSPNQPARTRRLVRRRPVRPQHRERRPRNQASDELATLDCLKIERGEVLPKPIGQIRSFQREIHDSLQKSELVARVVTRAVHLARVNRARLEQLPQPVRQLDLSGPVALDGRKGGEDVRSEHVASDDREIGWCLGSRRFLHEIANLIDPGPEFAVRLDVDDAVAGDVLAWDALNGKNGPIKTFEHVDQLANGRWVCIDHIVAQDDGERLVSHQFAGHEYRMAEAERFALTHVSEVYEVRNLPNLGKLIPLAARFEKS